MVNNPLGNKSSARGGFDHDLQVLEENLVGLGSMVEKAIVKAVDALKDRDLEASKLVIEEDNIIDNRRNALEETVVDMKTDGDEVKTKDEKKVDTDKKNKITKKEF